MSAPNFHPMVIGNDSVKLENVFLQANGMTGYQYTIKNKKTKGLSTLTIHWQWNFKKNQYEQICDGNLNTDLKKLKQIHSLYSFPELHNDTDSHQSCQ